MRRLIPLKKKIIKRVMLPAGLSLGVGTTALIGGKLPGVMGTTVTQAATTATPFVGPITSLSMVGMGLDTMKATFPIKTKLKRRIKKWENLILKEDTLKKFLEKGNK